MHILSMEHVAHGSSLKAYWLAIFERENPARTRPILSEDYLGAADC
jgi:hypothetical protein